MTTTSATDNPQSNPFQCIKEEWGKMQTWFSQVLGLPADLHTFFDRYGEFEDTKERDTFLQTLASAQQIAESFGDPSAVRKLLATEPEALTGITPPQMIYGHLIWSASQIQNISGATVSSLSGLKSALDPSLGDETTRAEASKSLLCGPEGLLEKANEAKTKIEIIANKIFSFKDGLLSIIYTFNGTNLVSEANQKIGMLTSQIERLQAQANEKRRQDREKLVKEIEALQADIERKKRFLSDLKGFFLAGNQVVPALQSLERVLNNRIMRSFNSWSDTLSLTCQLASEEQLSSITWLSRALDISTTSGTFQGLSEEAEHFVSHSLISSH